MGWREVCQVDTLGSVENENLRNLLRSGFIQLSGARDRKGRFLVHVFLSKADEGISPVGAAMPFPCASTASFRTCRYGHSADALSRFLLKRRMK